MDAAQLGLQYTAPRTVDSAVFKRQTVAEQANAQLALPELGRATGPELRLSSDRIELHNADMASGQALLSVKLEHTGTFTEGQPDMELGSLRSPYLQKRAQAMAKDLIQDPLSTAWENREVDGSTLRAAALGAGVLAAAVYGSSDVKSKLTLYKGEVGDYVVKPSIGISTGQGNIDFKTAKVSFSPREQGNTRWNVDAEYRPEDKRYGISFQRSVSTHQVGPAAGTSYLQATISRDAKQGSVAQLSYQLNF